MPAKISKVKEVSSTPSSVENGDSSRILLTKAINNLSVNRDSFAESVKTFQNLTKEMIDNLDLQIEDRSKQLKESKTLIENELKDAKIKASQKLAEHKREIAINFLAETGEVPIDESELESLREGHETVIAEHQTELNKLRDELTKKAKEDLQSAVSSQELRHKAVFAETQAENKMLKTEISNLHDYITKLKDEVNEQRKLSATIAQANSKESIHQTFGK
jgi:hypothetical protein|uniref:Uncharacterized protein n=1 Tax=viral metagenome TaxID=1070528 RepID=A0A6C0E7U8_9ZZZZ